MNIGTVKSADASPSLSPAVEKKVANEPAKQTQQANTRQTTDSDYAVKTHLSELPLKEYSVKVLSKSMETHLAVMKQIRDEGIVKSFGFEQKETEKLHTIDIGKAIAEVEEKPLFDFEKVASTVLDFVGGALTNAASAGADKEKLNDLLGQARKGVDRGIKEARDILGGDVKPGDIIDEGIKKSESLIKDGFNLFEDQINDPERSSNVFSYKSVEQQIKMQQEQSSSLTINTKDGDTVNINFASLQAFQARQQQIDANVDSDEGFLNYQQREKETSFYTNQEFAFEIQGELDEDEKEAIAGLVNDINKLSKSFFDGDIQAAFEQAKELGFDDDEISGFALDLKQTKQVQVMQSYQQVEGFEKQNGLPKSVEEPIQNYAAQLLKMMDKSKKVLSEDEDLVNTIQKVVGHTYQMSGQELLDAFQRFNHFNGILLGTELFESTQKPIEEAKVNQQKANG
ncbi:DUF5610 domain-containing protein [Catenovulum sp. SM1970]|uniref:DUF5610 domain-containing protein n=1 Tax=Marinifaba aquimaris TaxID=2741323 RepID=UPI0015734216|nr:DUF5610 domain-containing protein [Marinifaba aquimaris]NTS78883.1 DUF5610 domain-containing protein [Marinifaba aquimaris]